MKEIKLNAGLGRYDNVSPFVLGDLELYISNLPMVSGDFRFLAWCNGTQIGKYTLKRDDPRITIPHDKLEAGKFSCRVDHYNGETLVKRYMIEDLVITDLNTELVGVPEIEDIRSRLTALEEAATAQAKQIETLENALNSEKKTREELENVVADYRTDLVALIKWAYGVQNDVPYLDGDDLDKFLKRYGISLSDEEKSTIGGSEDEL